jgi:hypothetical protein
MASKSKDSDSREAEQAGAEAQEQDRLLMRLEDIRRRAYEIYLERGAEPGLELEDCLQAERELTRSRSEIPAQ